VVDRGLHIVSDVGTGGFNGFTRLTANVYQVRYFAGDHGRALESFNHPSIASWLLERPDHDALVQTLKSQKLIVDEPDPQMTLLSRAAAGLVLTIVAGLAYLVLFGRHPIITVAAAGVVAWMLNVV
jgi:hypothetical protein